MIVRIWRSVTDFLASAWLAIATLAFVGVWSIAATAVPQGAEKAPAVAAWAADHPAIEPVVRALGLHQAFTTWIFIACVALLGVSTVVCSWRRTRAALARARALRAAAMLGPTDLAGTRDFAVALAAGTDADRALGEASSALAGLGIRAKASAGMVRAVSPAWSVWGSAIFHWSLVALMLIIMAGQLVRSDGLMAVSVGETKPDAAASYGILTTGPLHSWSAIHRSFRVDALDPDLKLGGIDRGAVPTVSVLDGSGGVVKTQLVYPNMMLHVGSLAINCPDVGLSAHVALVGPDGTQLGQTYEPIDFSQTTTDGTAPVRYLAIVDVNGQVTMHVGITVPLDRSNGQFGNWIPQDPRAHVVIYDNAGTVLSDSTIHATESVPLPGGRGSIELLGIGWYARLSIVDDWTPPYIYTAMVLALIGLSISLLARQQILVATVIDGAEGPELAVRMRLWRNVPATRGEIERALRASAGARPEEPAVSEPDGTDKEIDS